MGAKILKYKVGDTPQLPFVYKVDGVATSIVGYTLTAFLKRPDSTVVSIPHTAVDEVNGVGRFDTAAGNLIAGTTEVDITIDPGTDPIVSAINAMELIVEP